MLLIFALVVAGCGSSSSSSSSGGATTAATGDEGGGGEAAGAGTTIGLALPNEPNDHSFGEASHDGGVKAEKEFGITVNEIDALYTPKTQNAALQNLARTNDAVMMAAAIPAESVTGRFPDTDFVSLGGFLEPADNTYSFIADWHPVGYIAGVVAAEASKSGTIGAIGAEPIPPITDGIESFKLGAESVNPKIKVVEADIGSFVDATKGKEAAQAQISSGADVIYADVDAAHAGIVQAAEEAGGKVQIIGSIAPKCQISGGLSLGNTILDQEKLTYEAMKKYVEGTLEHEEIADLKTGFEYFEPCPETPPAIKKLIEKTTEELKSGKIDPAAG